MTLLKRVYGLLRSRKLAIGLIAAFVGYSVIATISADKGDYSAPYAHPVFLVITAVLTGATASCALERTVGAIRAWRSSGHVSATFMEGLKERPQIKVALGQVERTEVMSRTSRELKRMGLRVRSNPDRAVGRVANIALLGSPLFHWSLVLLFLLVALGQLTRSEGLMGLPVGSSVVDAKEAYGKLDEGALHASGFTGLTFRVPEMAMNYVADGVDRGASPVVEVYDGPELIVSHRTYPNSPLRYRSLMIHANNVGLAARFVLEKDGPPDSVAILYDFAEKSGVAENVSTVELTRSGLPMVFTTKIELDRAGAEWLWDIPQNPRVAWTLTESGESTSGVLSVGQAVDLGEGEAFRLTEVTRYARLSVVDDWSVTPIYILFVLAGIGLTLALLLPPKTVWVMLVEKDGEWFLHARTRQSRGDRLFPDRIEEALRAAVAPEGGAS